MKLLRGFAELLFRRGRKYIHTSSNRVTIAVRLRKPRCRIHNPAVRIKFANIDAVHPVELSLVKDAVLLGDSIEREMLTKLITGDDRRLAVKGPSEQRQIVHHRIG